MTPRGLDIMVAQEWLSRAQAAGLMVTSVGNEVYVKGKDRTLIDEADQHREALLVLLADQDPDDRFALARALYPRPEVIEGKGAA